MVSPGIPRAGSPEPEEPAAFRAATASLTGARFRSELAVEPMPAPQRIAPFSTAIAAELVVGDTELATGRLIVLHDPAGNTAWDGTYRLVAYARAHIDPEAISDPFLSEVGWSYLTSALDEHGAAHGSPSGSVTRVATDGFGAMEEESSAQLEIRASWTPVAAASLPDGTVYPDLAPHAQAWAQSMWQAAGLEPVPEGVAVLSEKRGSRTSSRT